MLRSSSSSESRPTIGACRPGTPRPDACSSSSTTTNALTGCALPFSSRGPRGSSWNEPRAPRAVRSPITTVPGSAADCNRAAAFTVSPVTMASPGRGSVVARTSPVFTPMRICNMTSWLCTSEAFTSSRRRSILIAARTARVGSSSCAVGTPNAAITASPMNFSTVPPSPSISSRIAAKNRSRTSRMCSGSSCSPRAVEPVTSANRTVTSFRSSPVPEDWMVAAAPHAGQNRASAGNGSPHVPQGAVSALPHAAQNRPPSGFSAAHAGQVRMRPSVFAATDGEEVRTSRRQRASA